MERIEIKEYNKQFGAYLAINTKECESLAVDVEKPLI